MTGKSDFVNLGKKNMLINDLEKNPSENAHICAQKLQVNLYLEQNDTFKKRRSYDNFTLALDDIYYVKV